MTTSHWTKMFTQLDAKPVIKAKYIKNNEKKVASVVKEGTLQVDRKQLREDYEDQISKIDF